MPVVKTVSESDLDFIRSITPDVVFTREGSVLFVGATGHGERVVVEWQDEQWVTSTDDWHGHYPEALDALVRALWILAGDARTAKELRNGVLAESWLEFYDDGIFRVEQGSVFLNPFDIEEWGNESGEIWTVQRKHRRLLDIPKSDLPWGSEGFQTELGEITEWTRQEERALIHSSESPTFSWIAGEFGNAAENMRWTTDKNFMFVFQAPKGWKAQQPPPENDSVFNAPHGELGLRVSTFFRDTPEPLAPPLESPVRPSSIEYSFEAEGSHAPGWELHRWDVLFSTGEEDMMARVDLYRQLNGHDALPYKKLLDETLPGSRYKFG
jgi:hypothetical protein